MYSNNLILREKIIAEKIKDVLNIYEDNKSIIAKKSANNKADKDINNN